MAAFLAATDQTFKRDARRRTRSMRAWVAAARSTAILLPHVFAQRRGCAATHPVLAGARADWVWRRRVSAGDRRRRRRRHGRGGGWISRADHAHPRSAL